MSRREFFVSIEGARERPCRHVSRAIGLYDVDLWGRRGDRRSMPRRSATLQHMAGVLTIAVRGHAP